MSPERDTEEGETVPLSHSSAQRTDRRDAARAVFSLLIYHRDGVSVVPLAPEAPVTIGRGQPSEVVVADRSLSRQHARFLLAGGVLRVEDLGSTNGTRVRGELVERAELRPGDAVVMGGVTVSPHMRSGLEPALPGLASHDTLAAALAAELVRGRYFGEGVAVMFVRPLDTGSEQAHLSRWWRKLCEALRPVDTAALYSASALEVVLPRVDDREALGRAAALVGRAPRGLGLACGVATFPGSGSTADELLEASRSAARAATSAEPVRQSWPVRSQPAPPSAAPSEAVVSSRALREIFETAERLARARLPVLLVGETGTGKEVVARAIHERGPRANGPMVCVNCGAIPRDLVESTLFGHVKGAFTGASEASRGVFGAADGGTVLLDEVGELPAAAQAALLRALEHGRVHPVGASEETEVDVRVVAATHRDLEAMCEEGSFRGDLFYRLDAFRLLVPPLRERPEDIVPLARHFLAQACARGDAAIASIAPDALEALGRHDWPGNVRELRNAIERAAVIARAGCITADDLPERVRAAAGFAGPVAGEPRASADEASNEDGQLLSGEGDLRARVGRYEARVIAAAIHAAGGNQTEAARLLGVPVRTLSDKIRRLGVPLERRRG